MEVDSPIFECLVGLLGLDLSLVLQLLQTCLYLSQVDCFSVLSQNYVDNLLLRVIIHELLIQPETALETVIK